MTARGTATLRIVCGDIDALRDAVGDYLGYEDDTTPADVIDLDDVNWLDAHALIDATPPPNLRSWHAEVVGLPPAYLIAECVVCLSTVEFCRVERVS